MTNNNTMKMIPKLERPYEKCEVSGSSSLSDAELLAVILRTGTSGKSALELANEILYQTCESEGVVSIHHLSLQQLLKLKGVGKVKAIQILCISELAKRLAKARISDGVSFQNPESIAQYYMEDMRHHHQENLKLLMLNGRGRLIGETNISKGTVNAALISPRELFIEALQREAVSIIILHNHPSGDPTPSKEDVLVTKRIYEAGNLIGVTLLDHIIIGNNCYISLCEKGLIS